MEEYNQINENSVPKGNFLYSSSPVLATNCSSYGRASSGSNVVSNQQTQMPLTWFHLHQSEANPIVKTEVNRSQNPQNFQYLLRGKESSSEVEDMKAKIIAHPHCSNLLEAYMDCQKVGAPNDVAARLAAAREEFEARRRSLGSSRDTLKDLELDQFMEAYYDMLVKYRDELMRPMQEALDFTRRIEAEINLLSNGLVRIFSSDEKCEGYQNNNSSDGEAQLTEIDPRAEDRELKKHLLRKHRGYLSSLKQELSKKKKKGKLPKEAKQELLSWWELHHKWPYPSETEKMGLAESTGLDQKQINNWFINQRKRHWKPSEDMQFLVMDSPNTGLYMDAHYMSDGPYRLGPS